MNKQRPKDDHDALIEIWEGLFSENGLVKQMSNHMQHHLTTNKVWIACGVMIIGQLVVSFAVKMFFG